jgi:RNA polymerase subunit RPABC4/transcription elongation factor Spt4
MPYCSNCGTEYDPGESFCAECGDDLDGPAETEPELEPEPEVEADTEAPTTKETGTCVKCDSEISVEADKCPQCGYEPASSGILGGLLSGLSAMAFILLGGLVLIVWVVVIGTDFGLTDAIYVTAFLLFLMLFPGGVLYAKLNQELKTPSGAKKDWREEILGDD